MKKLSLTIFLVSVALLSQAQTVGVGAGTAGISVKTRFESLKLATRLNPLFSSRFSNTFVLNGYAMAGLRFLKEESGELYTGLGFGSDATEFRSIVKENRWYLFAPLGAEVSPFANKRIALCMEAGPRFDHIEGELGPQNVFPPDNRIGFSGLLEFLYYF